MSRQHISSRRQSRPRRAPTFKPARRPHYPPPTEWTFEQLVALNAWLGVQTQLNRYEHSHLIRAHTGVSDAGLLDRAWDVYLQMQCTMNPTTIEKPVRWHDIMDFVWSHTMSLNPAGMEVAAHVLRAQPRPVSLYKYAF